MSGTSKKSLGSGGRKSYKIKFEEKELELAKQKQNFLKLYKMVLDIKEDMGPDEENWKYMMSNFDGDETIDQVMEKAAELLTKVKSGNLALKDGCFKLYLKARDNYRVVVGPHQNLAYLDLSMEESELEVLGKTADMMENLKELIEEELCHIGRYSPEVFRSRKPGNVSVDSTGSFRLELSSQFLSETPPALSPTQTSKTLFNIDEQQVVNVSGTSNHTIDQTQVFLSSTPDNGFIDSPPGIREQDKVNLEAPVGHGRDDAIPEPDMSEILGVAKVPALDHRMEVVHVETPRGSSSVPDHQLSLLTHYSEQLKSELEDLVRAEIDDQREQAELSDSSKKEKKGLTIYKLVSELLNHSSDRVTLRKLSLQKTLKPGQVAPKPTEVQIVIDHIYDVWSLMREPGSESGAGKRKLKKMIFRQIRTKLDNVKKDNARKQ